MNIAAYVQSERFLSFRVGYPAAAFLAVYWSVVAFVLRLVFGAHSLTQAGTESVCFCLGMFLAYVFGYYVPIFTAGRLVELLSGNYSVLSTKRTVGVAILFGALMLSVCWTVNALVPEAFTSLFWILVYSVTVGYFLRLGVRDKQLQNWSDQGIA